MKTILLFFALLCGAVADEAKVTWPDVWRLEIAMCDAEKDEAVWLYGQCVQFYATSGYRFPEIGKQCAETMSFVAVKLLPEWEGRRQRALSDIAKWEAQAK